MQERKILIVEDDFLNRRLMKKRLTESGYEVAEAKNDKEAHALLNHQRFDLIILDINLGEGETDGISLGKKIKETYSTPFIYITAYETADIIDRAIASAPYSYMTKPFKPVDLLTTVEIAIRHLPQIAPKPTIQVKQHDYTINLPLDDIDYIMSEGNYLLVYSNESVYRIRSTIRLMAEKLPESIFTQVHRAYIVNRNKIEKYKQKNIVIKNNEIPLSKNYAYKFDL